MISHQDPSRNIRGSKKMKILGRRAISDPRSNTVGAELLSILLPLSRLLLVPPCCISPLFQVAEYGRKERAMVDLNGAYYSRRGGRGRLLIYFLYFSPVGKSGA